MEVDYSMSSNASTSGSEISQDTIRLEEFCYGNTCLHLPQDLCENKNIFKEFFSLNSLKDCFSEQQLHHLNSFLPTFPTNDAEEKERTLKMLFSRNNIRFGNPLIDFHEHLKNGNFTRDISKLRILMMKAQRKAHKLQRRRYFSRLLKEVLISREMQLQAISNSGPGVIPRVDSFVKEPTIQKVKSSMEQRVKKRYFLELEAVRQEVGESDHSSEDENYPEGPPPKLSKKQRRQLMSLEGSLNPEVERITSTLASKPSGLDLESNITVNCNPYEVNEDNYKMMLLYHKRRKLDGDISAELNTKGITLHDIEQRLQITRRPPLSKNGHRNPSDVKPPHKKKSSAKASPIRNSTPPSLSDGVSAASPQVGNSSCGGGDSSNESDNPDSDDELHLSSNSATLDDKQEIDVGDNEIQRSPVVVKNISNRNANSVLGSKHSSVLGNKPTVNKINNAHHDISENTSSQPNSSLSSRKVTASKVEDLNEVDVMKLPVDIDGSITEPLDSSDPSKMTPELTQETHACFFSLIRDVICSTTGQRMSLSQMEDHLKLWQGSPISPLNHWYSFAPDSWLHLLHSAINFLSGDYPDVQPEDFVPYLEYKSALALYQWIGAGRDSDSHLTQLCDHWLDHREEMEGRPTKVEDSDDIGDVIEERANSPPPPRCPTSWVIRVSTPAERESFRKQERVRYENPHKAFTYRMHGYESVVGPVKGVYNLSVGVNKPRGHSLLMADRPNYVTILTLVRDATARLPNGEGTRSDICELLKDSQYLAPVLQESYLHSVVSGALDRLHYEPDPCVKYDTKRKIWIYLHRGRTEDEFERIHREHQGILKPKKTTIPRKALKKKDIIYSASSKDTLQSNNNATQLKIEVSLASLDSPSCLTTSTTTTTVLVPRAKIVSARSSLGSASQAASSTQQIAVSSAQPLANSNIQKIQTTVAGVVPGKSLLTSSAVSSTKTVLTTNGVPVQQIQAVSAVRSNTLPSSTVTTAEMVTTNESLPKTTVTMTIPVSVNSLKSLNPNVVNTIQTARSSQLITARNSQNTAVTAGKSLVTSGLSGMKLVNTVKTVTGGDGTQTIYIKPTLSQQQKLVTSVGEQGQTQQQIFQKQAKAAVAQLQHQLQQQQLKQIQQQQQMQNITVSSAVPQHRVVTGMSVLNQGQTQPRVVARVAGKPVVMSQVTVPAHHLQQNNISTVQSTLTNTNTTTGKQQQPVVAKVITNAQGQVISMESLLAHQKQHGSLPQGTALRVASAKPGQTSLIQIPSTTPGGMAQFAVVSQGNLISVAQPRVIHAQVPSQSSVQQTQVAQTPQQQLQHHVQSGPRLVNAQTNKTYVGAASSANIRTLTPTNAPASINLAHIGGKPILLASKAQSTSVQGGSGQMTTSPQTVVLAASQAIRTQGGTLVLQQGGAQQIILPQGFQGGTLNIKALQGLQGLQGLKVIPLPQGTPVPGKGHQQVYARIISPSMRTTASDSPVNVQGDSTQADISPSPTTSSE